MRVVAGVDSHRDSHSIVFLDRVGKVLKQLTIPTTQSGYASALRAAKTFDEVMWGLEGTGSYASAFARVLLEANMVVYEVPGNYTKRHRQHGSERGKSDLVDAKAIAEAVLREAERLPRYTVSPEREAIRLRYDQRDRLVRERTTLVNRLRSAALRLDLTQPRSLRSDTTLHKMEVAARKLQGKNVALDALVDEVLYAAEDIRKIDCRVKEIESLLRPLTRRIAPELLAIYGVSTVIAAGLIGHAGDLSNCRNADAFAMKCGTAPISCSSGLRNTVRVNRGGNRQLNRLVHTPALVQVRSGKHEGYHYYQRKRAEGKSPKSALRALKRQLTTVIFYRLSSCAGRLIDGCQGLKAA